MGPGLGLWLFAVSLGASALGGTLGMAGGIFVVPVLTTFGHIDIRTAIGASLVSVIACSCGSASPFLKGGLVNVRLAVVLETVTTLGALTGVLLAGVIPTAYLFLLFALILALSAQQMLARRGGTAAAATTADTWGWAGARFAWMRATPTAAGGWRTGSGACRRGCC
jgi:uncharacterized membrane protein YfcA